MPPLRGIESVKATEAKGSHSELRVLETAAPFVRALDPSVPAQKFIPREERGLSEFMGIGERAPKDLEHFTQKIRKSSPNDLEMQPPPGEKVKGIQAMIDGPPPITGLRSLLQNVGYYFRAAMSGGFGGPMMIFSFLLRPKNQLSAGPERMSPEQFELARQEIFSAADASYTVNLFAKVEKGDWSYVADEIYSSTKMPAPGGGERFQVITRAWDRRGNEPRSVDQINHYDLYVHEVEVSFRILSVDRNLVFQIHQAFLNKALSLQSFPQAREWILTQSPWANTGLLERLE